jgi:hypothetical protein
VESIDLASGARVCCISAQALVFAVGVQVRHHVSRGSMMRLPARMTRPTARNRQS